MPRGGRHHEKPSPACPGCRGRTLEITGPVEELKGMPHVPVLCSGCGRTWKTQSAQMVARVEGSR
jgi:hypothetical protein